MSGALETVLGTGGSIVGGAGGAGLGTLLCGPVCGYIGRALGSQAGKLAGRAAAGWIANQMEQADVNAEAETKATEAAIPCQDCGEIKCFSPPDDATPEEVEEFRRQLKEQQDTINNMKPEELASNIRNYAQNGRGAGDAAARRKAGKTYKRDRSQELERKYLGQGKENYAELAAKELAQEMANLNATHTLDLVAGGDGSISGMGNAKINQSLGSQWKGGRSKQLLAHADEAKRKGKKMGVTLEECPPKGGKGSNEGMGGADTPAPGTGDPGPPPTS